MGGVVGAEAGETLLVLAGPKGAGKTTLLTNALSYQAPLFGPGVDAEFQRTQPPGVGMEFRLRTTDVVERRTWASNPHLPDFAQRTPPLSFLVAHIDIMEFCQFSARDYAAVLNVNDNAARMAQGPQAAIFARYRNVHIATLNTPYKNCASWFNARAVKWGKPPSPNDVRLYSGSAEGVAAFEAVHAAWLMFAASLNNVVARSAILYDGEVVRVGAA